LEHLKKKSVLLFGAYSLAYVQNSSPLINLAMYFFGDMVFHCWSDAGASNS
jgi:hypothetical protein